MSNRLVGVGHHRGALISACGFVWIVQLHSCDRAKTIMTQNADHDALRSDDTVPAA
jgi:hypothetical protein